MPMVVKSAQFTRTRTLISGFSMSGKTHSLLTFIYGGYDVNDHEPNDEGVSEHEQALEYAHTQGKHMVILSCPGETGMRTLPEANDYITPIYFEVENPEEMKSYRWSQQALAEFATTEREVIRNKPDILAYDGLHGMAMHQMNDITKGDFLAGVDLNINPDTGRAVQFRAAGYYSRLDNTFGQTVASIYALAVPTIVCTTREKWKGAETDHDRPKGVEATRYLWPNIPGDMALQVVGYFDARVSARLENTCIYPNCEDRKAGRKHHVWQFAPAGDVMGVGIKGLTMRKQWRSTPFIHQYWDDLKVLMGVK